MSLTIRSSPGFLTPNHIEKQSDNRFLIDH